MKNNLTHLKKTALVSALLIEIAAVSHAATINVDGTTCNLTDAINAANTDTATGGCAAGSGADILELDINGSPFTLAVQLPSILSEVTINGNNSVISGGDVTRIVTVGDFGGGVGNATINDVTFSNGYSPGNNFGAGIRAYTAGTTMDINRSTFTNNRGGAVLFSPGTSGSVTDTLIQNNDGEVAAYYSGGLSISGASVTVSNSTISNNTTVSTSSGGGGLYITNYGGPLNVSITNTTITGNSATLRGGGISHTDYGNGSTVTMTNVTLAANTSDANGGGLSNDAANITISQSLISGNSGTGGTEVDSSGGTITVDDYNLFGLNSTAGVVGLTVGATDIVPPSAAITDILDVNLADNGGPTPTHALNSSSPALDVIPGASCASATDQTGKSRPIDALGDGMADCDVGAFENLDIIFKNGFD